MNKDKMRVVKWVWKAQTGILVIEFLSECQKPNEEDEEND